MSIRVITITLFSWLLILSSPAIAHSTLHYSSPSHQQNVAAPKQLELVFAAPVRLFKLMLTGPNKEPVDFGFNMSQDKQTRFTYDLPSLPPGKYWVEWTIIGADSHRVAKTFSFTITP